MHCTWTHQKYTRDTEGVLYELKKSSEEKKYHPRFCVRPYHKNNRELEGNPRREKYGKGIYIRNRNKENFEWDHEEIEEYSGLFQVRGEYKADFL